MQEQIILQNKSFFNELQEYGKSVKFTKENNPISYENTDKYFYIIISGRVKIFNMNMTTNREQTLFLLGRGDMFDTIVLLDGKPNDIMTEVLEDGEAIQIPIERVRTWMETHSSFKSYLLPYISRQLRSLEELSTDLSLLNTSERLTKLIIKDIESSGELLRGLSHTEMGNLIGTIRHVIERHLKENQIIKK